MNAKALLDSRKFCLLMDDLARTWKDKKATDEDREMRLDAVLGQLGIDVSPIKSKPLPVVVLKKRIAPVPMSQVDEGYDSDHAPRGGFVLEDDEPAAKPAKVKKKPGPKTKAGKAAPKESPIGYVDRQRALRQNPNIELNKMADIIVAAVKAGKWDATGTMQISLPKNASVTGLEALLRERKVVFTQYTASLPMVNQKIDPGIAKLDLAVAEKMPAGQGHRVGGWVITLIK